ncbi:Molybdopterin synthase catalytic subunit [compost metagenome]
MVTFTGIVRTKPEDPITALILECYPELAENELAAMTDTASARFGLIDAQVIHRYGRLVPGETIMMVATLAPHRQAAFDGAQFLMDYLKTGAPFWKQEETPNGLRWVEAKSEDDAARERWSR